MSETITALQQAVDRHRAGDLAGADLRYRDVLEQVPDHPTALHLFGLLHLGRGDAAGAVPLLRRAVALRPAHAAARRALAEAEAATDDLAAAADNYALALAACPDPSARAARALVLLRLGERKEALAEAEAALAADPGADQMVAMGAALRANDRALEAKILLRAAVAAAPGNSAAWTSLGLADAALGRLDEAETHLRRGLALNPDAAACASLALVLAEAGRLDAALEAAEEAVRLAPGDASVAWARAWVLLLSGDFPRGLAAYEARKRHPRFARDFPRLPGPEWQRGDLTGRRLLVRAEQGLGDTIQFARYVPELARRGARVVLACPPPLVPLLAQLPAEVVSKSAPLPEHDLWVDAMSLPRLFGTIPATIPSPACYLAADPHRVALWAERLPPVAGRRVGFAWAGNPNHPEDGRRSLPPPLLAGIARLPGIVPVSLQVGPSAGAAEAVGMADLAPPPRDFADTAAIIATLDLVVSVDTAVAHLAGAMGKPTWLLLSHAPDWRWMTGRTDSPWYSAMRLFRQPSPGDWTTVIGALAEALAHWADGIAGAHEAA